MKKALILTATLVLISSQAGAQQQSEYPRWERAQQPLPPEVLEALPRDIPGENVIVRIDDEVGGPCYYYQIAGLTYPLPSLRMVEEGFGNQPYCIM